MDKAEKEKMKNTKKSDSRKSSVADESSLAVKTSICPFKARMSLHQ